MEYPKHWTEHFNVSPEQLKAWENEAPQGMPTLFWCLMEDKIPFGEYAAWAKEKYGLVQLKPGFFENSSNFEALKNFPASSEWTPWNMPLSQWEGLTYVGCVAPPQSKLPTHVYVLAPPVELNEFYKQIFSPALESMDQPPAIPETTDAPDGLNVDFKTGLQEAPQGLNWPSATQFSIPIDAPPLPDVMPVGMTHTNFDLSVVKNTPTGIHTVPEITSVTAISQVVPMPQENKETAPQPAAIHSASTPPTDFKIWWEKAKTQFANALILTGTNTELKLSWRNGEDFEGSNIPLNQPSLFRIAVRTQKPYHGFVVENEIHKNFFQSFGVSEFPKPVTAMAQAHPNGEYLLVLCYGFLGSDPTQELPMAEELFQDLTPKMPHTKIA